MSKKGRQLYPVYCKKCDQLLCWAITGSKTFCPDCQVWTEQQEKKRATKAGVV